MSAAPRLLDRAWILTLALTLCLFQAESSLAQEFEADYEIRFEATWSATTHPTNFPGSPHFSGLVGALHSDALNIWAPGGTASLGIESMAETGSKTQLLSEVAQAVNAGLADSALSGGGIELSPGAVVLSFTANQDYPLMSIVSMLAPSPDWFVGVHDYELFGDQGWVFADEVVLFTYDAGTDSGPTYNSDNDDTNPQDPITLLDGFPLTMGVPVGTLTITRVPEPGFLAQLGLGVTILSIATRRRFELSPRSTR